MRFRKRKYKKCNNRARPYIKAMGDISMGGERVTKLLMKMIRYKYTYIKYTSVDRVFRGGRELVEYICGWTGGVGNSGVGYPYFVFKYCLLHQSYRPEGSVMTNISAHENHPTPSSYERQTSGSS